jgi:hypothetical protein
MDVERFLDGPEIPPVVRAWVSQLLDPSFLTMMRAWPADQIDVRLSASKGKVRRLPEITLNGGPQQFDTP